jgi:hypothetical protein
MRSLLAVRQLQAGCIAHGHQHAHHTQRAATPPQPSAVAPRTSPNQNRRAHAGLTRPSAVALAPTQAPLTADAADRRTGAPTAAAGSPAAGAHCFSGCSAASSLGWSTSFANHFTLGSEVGRGSFGVVHKAVARATGGVFAVKILPKRPGGGSSSGASPPGSGCTSTAAPAALAGASASSGGGSSEEFRVLEGEVDKQQLEAIEREAAVWTSVQVGLRAHAKVDQHAVLLHAGVMVGHAVR